MNIASEHIKLTEENTSTRGVAVERKAKAKAEFSLLAKEFCVVSFNKEHSQKEKAREREDCNSSGTVSRAQ